MNKKLKDLEKDNEKSNNKEEEIEEKNNQINELVSKLNDNEIQIKHLKFDNDKDLKKLENNIIEKEKKIKSMSDNLNEVQNDNEELIKENKKIKIQIKQMKDNNNNDSNVNNELMNIMEQNTQLIKEKNDLEKELSLLKDNNILITEENNNYKKENDSLNNKINKISEENNKLKKIIKEKDKEIKDIKEINTALIENQKNQVEQEFNLSPSTHKIITSKRYKKLIWYLIYKKNDSKKKDQNSEENNYSNYKWVTGLILKKDKLNKYNKYETEEQTIKEMQDYIFALQKKLERKEESLIIMDYKNYKNKKLIEQKHNKTANIKELSINNLIEDISKNTLGENTANFSAINEVNQLKNEISKLKEEIKAKEKLESVMPKDINIVSQDDNSGFLDEDIKENKNGGMLDFIKISNNDNMEETNSRRSGAQKKVDDYLNKGLIGENDLDIIKQNEEQMKLLKNEIKEKNNKFNMLSEQIEELFKNIKLDMKNKPQIVQIYQILGKSPEEINKIVNKKKSLF